MNFPPKFKSLPRDGSGISGRNALIRELPVLVALECVGRLVLGGDNGLDGRVIAQLLVIIPIGLWTRSGRS